MGLGSPAYEIEWSQDENFESISGSATASSSNYLHTDNLPDGTWFIRVRAVDGLDQKSEWSDSGQVLVDTTAPTTPGTPSTTTPTSDSTPAWSWSASTDSGVGLKDPAYEIEWSQDENFETISGSSNTNDTNYTTEDNLGDGTWYFRVRAVDNLENKSEFSQAGSVLIDTTAPSIPGTPVTDSPTSESNITWSFDESTDSGVGLKNPAYEVQWSQDENFSDIAGSSTTAAGGTFETSLTGDGRWYARLRAVDITDNKSEWSDSGQVLVDTTAPTTPGTPSTTTPTSDSTPAWSWSASTDSGVGLKDPAYEIEWSQDENFENIIGSSTSAENSFTHTSDLDDGTWYLRVRALDAVVNASDWANGNVVIDSTAPTTPGTPSTTTPTSDSTPAWSWTASTDSGVGLADDAYLIEWSMDDGFELGVNNGEASDNSFSHPDQLADGTWYFRVRSIDKTGNLSEYSQPGSVLIDTTAPSVPGIPSTTSPTTNNIPSWTWSSSTDNSGSGLADDAYLLEWSQDNEFSSIAGSTTVATNSYTHSTPLADGTWYIRVRAVDIVGNESDFAASGNVVIDTTPPSTPGTPTTSTPTSDSTPTWLWSPSTDNVIGLTASPYYIEWSQDNEFSSIAGSTTVATNSYTHSTPLADGTWYIRVRAVDKLNNASEFSDSGLVQISTDGPSDPGQPSTSSPTTDSTPAWTWSESTAASGLANPAYYIEWSMDSDFLLGVDSDTSNTNSFTHTDSLSDGIWYVRVRSEDNTGIFSSYSPAAQVQIDTTAPTTPGTPSTTTPTSDSTPAWTWSAATDAGVGLKDPAYEIEWSEDEDFNDVAGSTSTNDTSFTHTDDLADGTWYIRIRATDSLDNQSAWSDAAQVQIDTTAPTTPGTPSTTTPTSDSTPAWSWSASTDSGVGLKDPAYEVQWSQNSEFTGEVSTDTTNNTSFTHADNLADGTWYVRVRSIDNVNNQSAYSPAAQVQIDTTAPTAPGTPSTGQEYTNDPTPTWNWSASTDSGVGLGSPAYEVQWSMDSGFISGVSDSTAGGASFTHTNDLSSGTWYFRVRAIDEVGNQSGWSGAGSIVIDTDSPTAPGTPNTLQSPTTDNTPLWTWSESADSGSGFTDSPYQVQWSRDDNFTNEVNEATSQTESYQHTAPLSDGSWHFRVRAVDNAGNHSSWSAHATVIIDSTAPTVPENLNTTSPTKDSTPTWNWTASTDSGVGLKDPAYEVQWSYSSSFTGSVSTLTTNETTYTHEEELGFGIWHFRVRAIDNLENKSAWAVSSVNIDNTPPVLTSITAHAGSDGALITWTTNEAASSKVEYGAMDLSSSTAELNTDPRVTSHSMQVKELPSCATFKFRVISTDQLDNQAESSESYFTTTGCSGDAVITGQASGIIENSGGQVNLINGTASVSLNIPAMAISDSAVFQIKQLSPEPVISTISQPSGQHLLGSHLYDFKAVNNDNDLITSFASSVNVSIGYAENELAGFDLGSLAIYRHDGSSWHKLNDCQVNISSKKINCQTNNFSVFGLFGARTVAPPALPRGGGTIVPKTVNELTEENAVTNPGSSNNQQSAKEDGAASKVEAASENRGLSSSFIRTVGNAIKRPAAWASLTLLLVVTTVLVIIKKRSSKDRTRHVPYGIHRDD